MGSTGTKKLTIAIIGIGGRGFHAFGRMLAARSDATIGAFVDPNPLRLKAAVKGLGVAARCYATSKELFKKERPDGVIITSPDHTHEENCLTAITNGVPVLVDKPMATTSAGCLRIIEASNKAKVPVSVGFNLRHIAVLHMTKQLIADGRIGRLMLIENKEFYGGGRTYMSRWNRKYKLSGGLWVHKGSHDFDIFNWWNADGVPIRVAAFAGVNALRPDKIPFKVGKNKPVGPYCGECAYLKTCPDAYPLLPGVIIHSAEIAKADGYRPDLCMYISDKDTHDNGISIVEYDNNVRASHLECFIANFSDRRYTVVGDRGILELSLEKPTEILFRPRWGSEDLIIHVPPMGEGGHGGSDPNLLETFLTSLRTGATGSSTALDGIRSVAVGEAAEISWRNHRMVDIRDLVDFNAPLLRAVVKSGKKRREAGM